MNVSATAHASGFRLPRERSGRPTITTRSEPCPICEREGCAKFDGGSLLVCRRGGADAAGYRHVRSAEGGAGQIYVRDGEGVEFARLERRDLAVAVSVSDSAVRRARRYYEHPYADRQRRRLAAELGVSVRSLEGLQCGWKPGAYGVGAWSFPQRDSVGSPISVSLRIDRAEDRQRFDSDGRNKSPAGLIYVVGRWLSHTGPVHVVEGATDTAALDTLGFDVVGHGGTTVSRGRILDDLVAMLERVPADRDIVVVGERDHGREDDPESPGRVGARRTAQAIADRLGRTVLVALPPDAVKDSREWVKARGDQPGARGAWVAGLLAELERYEPTPDKPHRYEALPDKPPELELDDYRRDMRSRLDEWARSPDAGSGRVAILSAPAGVGKTTAVERAVVPHYETSIAAMPTHENVAERAGAIVASGVLAEHEVGSFPKLDSESCISFTREQAAELREDGHKLAAAAEDARRLGLSVRATACRGCPLAPWRIRQRVEEDELLAEFAPDVEIAEEPDGCGCRYWRDVERASRARHRIATAARVERSGRGIRHRDDGRTLVYLDESVSSTLFPAATVRRDLLESLSSALAEAGDLYEDDLARRQQRRKRRRYSPTAEQLGREKLSDDRAEDAIAACRDLAAVAAELAARIEDRVVAGQFGVKRIDLPLTIRDREDVRRRPVKDLDRRLSEALTRCPPRNSFVDSATLDLVRRVYRGGSQIDRLVVHTEQAFSKQGGGGSPRVHGAIVAAWSADLPPDADLLLLDATVDREALSKRIGRDIDDLGPPGGVRRQSPAIQFPRDISAATSPDRVAKLLESALAALPESKRVGLIMLSAHRDVLFPRDVDGNDIRTDESRELVPDDVLARIARDADGRLLVEHYGGGRDRGSNQWIEHGDGLIRLGTFRPPASRVVEELVRRREIDAAEHGSEWGEVRWEARDAASGELVVCHGRGYLEPEWASAANAITRASGIQSLERARTALPPGRDADGFPGGIPVVVVSNEPTGLPVVSSLPAPVSPGARRVRQILERMLNISGYGQDSEDRELSTRLMSPTGYRSNTVENVSLVGGLLSEVQKAGLDGRGCSRATAVRWIAAAVEAGLVLRSGNTTAARYGLPPPVEKVGGGGVSVSADAAPAASQEPVRTVPETVRMSTVVVSPGLADDILGPHRGDLQPDTAATGPPDAVGSGPPPDSAATGPPPADGWRAWEDIHGEPCLSRRRSQEDSG